MTGSLSAYTTKSLSVDSPCVRSGLGSTPTILAYGSPPPWSAWVQVDGFDDRSTRVSSATGRAGADGQSLQRVPKSGSSSALLRLSGAAPSAMTA